MPASLNTVDIVVIVVLIVAALNGLRRKLSGELASTISLIAALYTGLHFYHPMGEFLAETTKLSERPGVAFALTFVVTVLLALAVMILLRVLLKKAISVAVSSKGVDRIGGLLAGSVKAAVVIFIVIAAINMWPNDYLNRVFGTESVAGNIVITWMPEIRERINVLLEKDEEADEAEEEEE
jgi:uncharacterized membrane protein required for colicin V production